MQEGNKSTFFQKLNSTEVKLYTPSSTYCTNIMSQNVTITWENIPLSWGAIQEGYVT